MPPILPTLAQWRRDTNIGALQVPDRSRFPLAMRVPAKRVTA
jgi:hypothetical protein